ncbi:hypothetical protein DV738_g5217, partial [Chaetothyriales sp. CBS 135597]
MAGGSSASILRAAGAFRRQPVWIVLAVSSGACAALNGVFAKLTTTSVTSHLSAAIASFFSLDPHNTVVDLAVRGFFFAMNLAFNAAMWALFTAALTRGDSTTRVSIVNVSANFVVTALLGAIIFGESLPALWWLGAAFLAVGNVVIGRREEGEKGSEGGGGADAAGVKADEGDEGEDGEGLLAAEGQQHAQAHSQRRSTGEYNDGDEDEDGDLIELSEARADQSHLRRGEDVDAPL